MLVKTVIRPHDVVWTPERVERFWNYYSSNPALEDNYFAKAVGRDLIRYASRRIKLGAVLDMGCGRGDLIGYLVEDHRASGVDQSPDSVAMVNRKFGNQPNFQGASVGTDALPDASFATVFLVEVVEHLDDETLASVLRDARRLLKVGGHLVITTPHAENLEASKIICPECACIFHRVQHVRSWSAGALISHLEPFGFRGTAEATLLSKWPGVKGAARKALYKLRGIRPHLIYIGMKGSDEQS